MKMTPLDAAIDAFGSGRKLALALGIDPKRVYQWRTPPEKNGLDGDIPRRHHRKILEVARSRGLNLTAEDLILGRTLEVSA